LLLRAQASRSCRIEMRPSPDPKVAPALFVHKALAAPWGYIFDCNNATEKECLTRQIFGAPRRGLREMNSKPYFRDGSALLFLRNVRFLLLFIVCFCSSTVRQIFVVFGVSVCLQTTQQTITGPFRTKGEPGLNLVLDAFAGRYAAQVRFRAPTEQVE